MTPDPSTHTFQLDAMLQLHGFNGANGWFYVELDIEPPPGFSYYGQLGLLKALPTPNLAIQREGQQLKLAWPWRSKGYVLQSASTLAGSGDWRDVNDTPTQAGGNMTLTLPTGSSPRFYRLFRR